MNVLSRYCVKCKTTTCACRQKPKHSRTNKTYNDKKTNTKPCTICKSINVCTCKTKAKPCERKKEKSKPRRFCQKLDLRGMICDNEAMQILLASENDNKSLLSSGTRYNPVALQQTLNDKKSSNPDVLAIRPASRAPTEMTPMLTGNVRPASRVPTEMTPMIELTDNIEKFTDSN